MKKILFFLRLFSFILIVSLFATSDVMSLNTWDTGYRYESSQSKGICLSDSTCRQVANNATIRYTGTKTMGEWNSFETVAASRGVSVSTISCRQDYAPYDIFQYTVPIYIPGVGSYCYHYYNTYYPYNNVCTGYGEDFGGTYVKYIYPGSC